jgi:proteasome assembly chaperone (PAC2) family protein
LTDPADPPTSRPLSPLHRRWNRRLRSVAGIRGELSRLYGETREGIVDPQAAARLAHLLTSLARLIEASDFERRLAEIEAALQQQQAERQQRQRRPNGHHHPPPS